jgi:hypothetical protein
MPCPGLGYIWHVAYLRGRLQVLARPFDKSGELLYSTGFLVAFTLVTFLCAGLPQILLETSETLVLSDNFMMDTSPVTLSYLFTDLCPFPRFQALRIVKRCFIDCWRNNTCDSSSSFFQLLCIDSFHFQVKK